MAEPNKNAVIRQVYYDTDTGYGSISNTYKEANRILNSITYKDVKEFLERQESVQVKKNYRCFNSYVAKHKLEEIQIDIADFTESAKVNNGFRYCFVAVDVFTKFCHAVPIKDKKRWESIRAMKEVLEKMGTPKQIYRDNEGSWQTKEWKEFIRGTGIHDMVTSTHAPFAERMVQTIKHMVYDQKRGLEIPQQRWVEALPRILKKYNHHQVHSTIGMTPYEATKKNNEIDTYFNIRQNAQFNRKYPPLNVGDQVRKYDKISEIKKKGYYPTWSGEVFTVLSIVNEKGEKRYNIDDYKLGTGGTRVRQRGSVTRSYGRNELQLVKGRETKDTADT